MFIDRLEIANMNVHYFRFPLSYFMERQEALGFRKLVFWGSVPHIWVDQYGCEDVTEIKKMIENSSLKLSAYAARPYNYSLFAPKGSLQGKCSERYYRFCIDTAQKLGTDSICIDLWGALLDGDPAGQYENCLEMLAVLATYAKERNCAIIVGNVSNSCSALFNTLDEVQRMKRDIHMDNLKIALDIGAALDNGEDIRDWLNTFDKDLSMIYLADGRSTGTGYPLGFGCYPVGRILGLLQEYGYGGTVAIKMDREKNELDPAHTDQINISYLDRRLGSASIDIIT